MRIPVVFATDENYLFPTSVAIISILENARPKTDYIFYILVSPMFNKENTIMIKLKKAYGNFNYQYLTVDDAIFRSLELSNKYITVETYYRLILGELLKAYDRCIYLDGDVIVQEDLEELYTVEMEESYIAGVPDCGIQCKDEEYCKKLRGELGVSTLEGYVNAGVLVFNLKRIRDNSLLKQFLLHMGKRYSFDDQDVINIVCGGNIKYLPVRYNMFNGRCKTRELMRCGVFASKEDQDAILGKRISIIHYAAGIAKPWENLRSKFADRWWAYAKNFPDRKLLQKYYERARLRINKGYERKKCNEYKNVVIFSAGKRGITCYEELQLLNINNILCFCDNDISKQGKEISGLKVLSPEEIIDKKINILFIIATQVKYKEIYQQLQCLGIELNDIMGYLYKDNTYYKMLDEKYFLEELEDICQLEFSSKNNEGRIERWRDGVILEDEKWIVDKYWMHEWLLSNNRM